MLQLEIDQLQKRLADLLAERSNAPADHLAELRERGRA